MRAETNASLPDISKLSFPPLATNNHKISLSSLPAVFSYLQPRNVGQPFFQPLFFFSSEHIFLYWVNIKVALKGFLCWETPGIMGAFVKVCPGTSLDSHLPEVLRAKLSFVIPGHPASLKSLQITGTPSLILLFSISVLSGLLLN